MGMDKCIGMMEVFIKETGKMEYSMDKAIYMCQDKDDEKVFSKIMF